MSFAFLPIYTGDYLRDTRHLTPLKHGVYLLLLFHCWDQQGPLPLDEQECAGIANCRSADEVEALRYILERFFTRAEDGWYNHRMERELNRARSISTKREDAGRRGANERMRRFREKNVASAKQVLSNCLASDATPTPTPTPTPTTTTTGVDLALSQRGTSQASPDSNPESGSAVALIPLIGKHEFPVSPEFLAELEAAYPAVDGPATLREIRAWCISNPTKRKTARGARRFINAWFERTQNA